MFMKVKKSFLYYGLLFTSLITESFADTRVICPSKAHSCCPPSCKDRRAFIKLITGASFSRKANISVDPTVWDPSFQGYNAHLGTAPLLGAGFGYKFCDSLSGDISLIQRWGYKYNKFQTTPPNAQTPFALPSKTRKFDLDTTSLMFNGRLHGKGIQNLSCTLGNTGSYLAPILGGGIGLSWHKMRNFRSVFGPTILTAPASGVTAIGLSSTNTTSFSYQLEAGFEYRHKEIWGLSVGYRWFDGGKFKGPSHVIGGTGLPGSPLVGVAVPPWKGRLRSQEIFVEIAYHF